MYVAAVKSIDRYREIERTSGIPFYEEVGFLDIAKGPCQLDLQGDYLDLISSSFLLCTFFDTL